MADEFWAISPGTVGIASQTATRAARVFGGTFPHSADLPGALVADRRRAQDASTVRRASVLLAWLCAGMGSGLVMVGHQSTQLGDVRQLLGDGRRVMLEPEEWIRTRFPLLDWIRMDAPLDQGRWLVVLNRARCSGCETFLGQLG